MSHLSEFYSSMTEPPATLILSMAIKKRRALFAKKDRDFRKELLIGATISKLCKHIGEQRAARKRALPDIRSILEAGEENSAAGKREVSDHSNNDALPTAFGRQQQRQRAIFCSESSSDEFEQSPRQRRRRHKRRGGSRSRSRKRSYEENNVTDGSGINNNDDGLRPAVHGDFSTTKQPLVDTQTNADGDQHSSSVTITTTDRIPTSPDSDQDPFGLDDFFTNIQQQPKRIRLCRQEEDTINSSLRPTQELMCL